MSDITRKVDIETASSEMHSIMGKEGFKKGVKWDERHPSDNTFRSVMRLTIAYYNEHKTTVGCLEYIRTYYGKDFCDDEIHTDSVCPERQSSDMGTV